MKQAWSKEVGDGVATPSLVGDRLYVFSRQDDSEVLRCLNAKTGEEIWKDSYQQGGATGAASGFSGPRCEPTVANGKVVTFGVRGALRCYDAGSGELLWSKPSVERAWPSFFVSCAPIIMDDVCVAFSGGDETNGSLAAYDLTSGEQRWSVTGKSPAYGSPVLATVDGTDVLVTPGDNTLLAVNADSGELLWEMEYTQGRYNAATPIVHGQSIIIAGPDTGLTSFALAMEDGKLQRTQEWRYNENTVQFNTPIIKDGLLFGLTTADQLFCVNLSTQETEWTTAFADQTAMTPRSIVFGQRQQEQAQDEQRGQRRRGFGGRGGRGGRGRGGARPGYGSIVAAGNVLLALTPQTQMVVFEPSAEEFKELARYKVGESNTYAYPVATRNGIYVKDQNSVTLWTLE